MLKCVNLPCESGWSNVKTEVQRTWVTCPRQIFEIKSTWLQVHRYHIWSFKCPQENSVPGNSLIIDYQNRFNFMHTFGHFAFKPKISAAITNLFFFFFQIHFLVSPEKPREKRSFVFFAVFSKSHQGIFMKSGAAEWFCLLSIMQTSLSVEEEKGRFLCFPELFLPLISEFRETSVLLLVV